MNTSKLLITSLLAAAATMSVPAFAADYTVTGTFTSGDGATKNNLSGTITRDDGTAVSSPVTLQDGDNVTFSGETSGYLPGWKGDACVAWNIIIAENSSITLNNGARGNTDTFTGALSGSGDFITTDAADTNATLAPKSTTYVFAGDVTRFTGNFNAGSQKDVAGYGTGGIAFGAKNGSTAIAYSSSATVTDGVIRNISGSGTITTGGTLTYNYTSSSNYSTLSIDNSSITAKTLTFAGGANYTVSSTTVTGSDETTASNNTLTISAGTTTFTGEVSNFGNVAVASGATLAVGTGGSLDLSGARVTLASAIQNSGTVTVSDATVFNLTDSLKTGDAYTLISGSGTIAGVDWNTLTLSNFTHDGVVLTGRSSVNVSIAGAVTYTSVAAENLVWNGGSAGIWNTETTNTNWTNNESPSAFYTRDNVTFDTNGDVAVTVADGGVTAGTVNITAGTVSFTGGTITAVGGVSVTGGTAILAGTDLSALGGSSGNIAGSGRVQVTVSGEPDMDASRLQGFTGTLVISGSGRFGIKRNSGIECNYISDLAGIEVKNGAHLFLSAWSGDPRIGKLSTALTIAGAGYGSGDNAAALRLHEGSTLAGALTLSADATILSSGSPAKPNTISGGISASGKSLTLTGAIALNISGSNDITVGTLTLTGNKTVTLSATGTTTIGTLNLNEGTLKVTNGVVLDLTNNFARAGASVGSGATLEIDGAGSTVKISNGEWTAGSSLGMNYTNTLVALSNGGVFEVTKAQLAEGEGAAKRGFSISGGEGTYRYSGTGTSYIADNSSSGTNNQHIGLANTATLIFDVQQDTATLEVSKVIAATADATTATTGALKKIGAGTLTLTNANLYSGGTTISVGRLVAGHTNALGTETVTVESGAELGLVAGTTVTVTNGIDLASGAKIVVDLSGKATATETFTLELVAGTALSYSGGSVTSANADILLDALVLDGWSQSGWTKSLAYIDSSKTLSLTMTIPEPSVFGLLAGLGALALAGTRRRRQKKA